MTVVVVTLLTVAVFSGCDLYTYSTGTVQTNYDNPRWAPPYYSGARYYYLPDIETYYDLASHEFIFLNNGQWNYSSDFPSIYANFDLNNCFSVVLDVNVYRPWMHHHYYVSHYPRYYYRDYYDHSNIPYVRGFNENSRSAIYWGENERNRARKWDNEGLKQNRQFKYPKQERDQQSLWNNNQGEQQRGNSGDNRRNSQNSDDNSRRTPNNAGMGAARNDDNNMSRQQQRNDNSYRQPVNTDNSVQQPRNDNNVSRQPVSDAQSRQQTGRRSDVQRTSTNYYGRTIGQPVKVEKQMRRQDAGDNKRSDNQNSGRDKRKDD
jgi:hypothetical protein